MLPVSLTIFGESPTWVTTQGMPQAMASPTANGNASLEEELAAISNAE